MAGLLAGVSDEAEHVARVGRLGLSKRVDGKIEQGERAQTVIDQLFKCVRRIVIVHIDHQVFVHELYCTLIEARYPAVDHLGESVNRSASGQLMVDLSLGLTISIKVSKWW